MLDEKCETNSLFFLFYLSYLFGTINPSDFGIVVGVTNHLVFRPCLVAGVFKFSDCWVKKITK